MNPDDLKNININEELEFNDGVGDVVSLKAGNLDLPTGKKIIVQVDGGGSATIDDSLTSLELESPFAAISLVYVAADKWRIV